MARMGLTFLPTEGLTEIVLRLLAGDLPAVGSTIAAGEDIAFDAGDLGPAPFTVGTGKTFTVEAGGTGEKRLIHAGAMAQLLSVDLVGGGTVTVGATATPGEFAARVTVGAYDQTATVSVAGSAGHFFRFVAYLSAADGEGVLALYDEGGLHDSDTIDLTGYPGGNVASITVFNGATRTPETTIPANNLLLLGSVRVTPTGQIEALVSATEPLIILAGSAIGATSAAALLATVPAAIDGPFLWAPFDPRETDDVLSGDVGDDFVTNGATLTPLSPLDTYAPGPVRVASQGATWNGLQSVANATLNDMSRGETFDVVVMLQRGTSGAAFRMGFVDDAGLSTQTEAMLWRLADGTWTATQTGLGFWQNFVADEGELIPPTVDTVIDAAGNEYERIRATFTAGEVAGKAPVFYTGPNSATSGEHVDIHRVGAAVVGVVADVSVAIDQVALTTGDVIGTDITATTTINAAGIPAIDAGDITTTWVVNGDAQTAGYTLAEADLVTAVAAWSNGANTGSVESVTRTALAWQPLLWPFGDARNDENTIDADAFDIAINEGATLTEQASPDAYLPSPVRVAAVDQAFQGAEFAVGALSAGDVLDVAMIIRRGTSGQAMRLYARDTTAGTSSQTRRGTTGDFSSVETVWGTWSTVSTALVTGTDGVEYETIRASLTIVGNPTTLRIRVTPNTATAGQYLDIMRIGWIVTEPAAPPPTGEVLPADWEASFLPYGTWLNPQNVNDPTYASNVARTMDATLIADGAWWERFVFGGYYQTNHLRASKVDGLDSLHVFHTANSYMGAMGSAGNTRPNGAFFRLFSPLNVRTTTIGNNSGVGQTTATLQYQVRFAAAGDPNFSAAVQDFQFRRPSSSVGGGKIPGFSGGEQADGGQPADGRSFTTWSARLMWRQDNTTKQWYYSEVDWNNNGTRLINRDQPYLELYYYGDHMWKPNGDTFYDQPPVSSSATLYGFNKPLFSPDRGVWYRITEEVQMNTWQANGTPNADGRIRIWAERFGTGWGAGNADSRWNAGPVLVFDSNNHCWPGETGWRVCGITRRRIEQIKFDVVYGGNSAGWAPDANTGVSFRGMKAWRGKTFAETFAE